MQKRLSVESAAALALGVMVTSVRARRVFDQETRQYAEQMADRDTGKLVWTVEGYNVEVMKAPPIVTKSGRTFRESAEILVYVVSDEEPVIPDSEAHGLQGVVQFDGLSVMPWLDDKSCKGLQHDDEGERKRCGCQVKLSFRAYGMRPFRG